MALARKAGEQPGRHLVHAAVRNLADGLARGAAEGRGGSPRARPGSRRRNCRGDGGEHTRPAERDGAGRGDGRWDAGGRRRRDRRRAHTRHTGRRGAAVVARGPLPLRRGGRPRRGSRDQLRRHALLRRRDRRTRCASAAAQRRALPATSGCSIRGTGPTAATPLLPTPHSSTTSRSPNASATTCCASTSRSSRCGGTTTATASGCWSGRTRSTAGANITRW